MNFLFGNYKLYLFFVLCFLLHPPLIKEIKGHSFTHAFLYIFGENFREILNNLINSSSIKQNGDVNNPKNEISKSIYLFNHEIHLLNERTENIFTWLATFQALFNCFIGILPRFLMIIVRILHRLMMMRVVWKKIFYLLSKMPKSWIKLFLLEGHCWGLCI